MIFQPLWSCSPHRPPFFETPCLYVTAFRYQNFNIQLPLHHMCTYSYHRQKKTSYQHESKAIPRLPTSSVTLAVSLRLWVPTYPSGDYLHVFGEQNRKQPFFMIDKARASPVVSSVYRSHVPKALPLMWLMHSTMT